MAAGAGRGLTIHIPEADLPRVLTAYRELWSWYMALTQAQKDKAAAIVAAANTAKVGITSDIATLKALIDASGPGSNDEIDAMLERIAEAVQGFTDLDAANPSTPTPPVPPTEPEV